MSLSLEQLCAMVNVSYEEVKNISFSSNRDDDEGMQKCTGIVKCVQRSQNEHNVLDTSEEQYRPSKATEGVSSSDSEEDETCQVKRKRGPANWKCNIQKKRRMEGKSYRGKQKDMGEVTRAARVMGPRCVSKACRRSAKRFCHTFSEKDREMIFQNFWQSMNWEERRKYVAELVDHTPVARKRSVNQDSRRLSTLSYHLNLDGQRRRVCKKYFLSTLGIGEWSVAHWAQANELENSSNTEAVNNEALASLQAFLRDLPKVPSHYCQSSSSKLYLEPIFQSMSELHMVYQRYCKEKLQTTPLSKQIFMDEFNHLNLALSSHSMKEECDACCSYKAGHVKNKVCQNHFLIKEEKYDKKVEDKDNGIVSCMDLQALLLCPKLNAPPFYYKTKLAIHNLTLYNMAKHGGSKHGGLWHKEEGGLFAS